MEKTEKKIFLQKQILCDISNILTLATKQASSFNLCLKLLKTELFFSKPVNIPLLSIVDPKSQKKQKLMMLILLDILVGAIIPLSTAATTTTVTAITAVLAVIQVTSGYLPTTQKIFHDTKTFTVRGRAYRENWENFFTFDKGCLQVYIYMDSYNLLTKNRFPIGENVDYSINFNGIQGRKYIMR